MFDFNNYNYDFKNNQLKVNGEPMLVHCHHYNTFLQRSIMDAEYIDSKPFLVGAAAEVAYNQLKPMLSNIASPEERKKAASELFRLSGFGLLPLDNINEKGGSVSTPCSHYSYAWKEKFGKSETPVSYFSAGFLAGAYAAIYDLELKNVQAEQTACLSVGAEKDQYTVSEGKANFSIFEPKADFTYNETTGYSEIETNVDRDGITKAVAGLPLLGNESGLIPVFGVYLTRMYADYYNRISFEFEKEMIKIAGDDGIAVSSSLFVEAGHVCAFNTFGGIMNSPEWDGLILPSLKNKEDWVSAMTSCVNSLGWGSWKVMEASEKGAVFRVVNDYESIGYKRMYGKAEHGISYLVTGAAAGILDLIYLGDVASKPNFTPEFYEKLFKGPDAYKFELTKCQAQGSEYTEVVLSR